MKTNHFPEFKDISTRKIAYFASGVVLVVVAFAFVREIELKKDVPAVVVSQGEVRVRGVSGLVVSIDATPGAQVHAGQTLFQLQRDMSLADNGMTRDRFAERNKDERLRMIGEQASLRQQELQARVQALTSNLDNRRQELKLLDQELAELRRHVEEGGKTLQRLQALSDYVIADRIEQARSDLMQRRIALSHRLARQRELLSDMNLMQADLKKTRATLDSHDLQAQGEVQEAKMEYEKIRSKLVISAPVSGILSFSQVAVGNLLREEEVAMVIATGVEDGLRVALRVPSRQRGFIRPGQQVRLKFDAFPYARFGTREARIDAISRDAIAPAQGNFFNTPDSDAADYIAYAHLASAEFTTRGERHRLLPGMRATASVVTERRTIAEWFLAPVFEAFRD